MQYEFNKTYYASNNNGRVTKVELNIKEEFKSGRVIYTFQASNGRCRYCGGQYETDVFSTKEEAKRYSSNKCKLYLERTREEAIEECKAKIRKHKLTSDILFSINL